MVKTKDIVSSFGTERNLEQERLVRGKNVCKRYKLEVNYTRIMLVKLLVGQMIVVMASGNVLQAG